jgi:predicted nuclease of restriction endonuclease-like (RecB) superfamily
MNIHFLDLTHSIYQAHGHFSMLAARQVNTALTLRNWLIGFYIVAYEQKGADRAQYGERLMKERAHRLKEVKGLSERHLYLCKDFYRTYPQILQTPSAKLQFPLLQDAGLLQPLSSNAAPTGSESIPSIDPELLLNRLSFSHFIELMQAEIPLKRAFYETQALKNHWSVRELKRAMGTLLYERTGLSTDKDAVLAKAQGTESLLPADVIKNPYVLEFLGLSEKAEYSENDLEQAIINHLQDFLLEAGRGFCFEARQKRITFGNTHYRIDLVFYHRILKCHVLVDLKLGEFTHADAGQMNVYLNYYQDQEMTEGDNPPIGIILCAQKDDALVKYATGGLPQPVFVSKYLVNLPSEEALRQLIREEQEKFS